MKVISLIAIIILIISVGTLPGNISLAETIQKISETPRGLALHFLKLDFEGALLSSDSYNKSGIGEFIAPGEYRSPGWDTVVLINKYEIEKISQKSDQATVIVKYDVIGSLSNELTIKRQKKSYTFRFKREGQRWFMIEPYDLAQHISVSTAITHLEHLLVVQGDTEGTTKGLIENLKQLNTRLNK
jgi:hypothetical protein